MQSASAELPIQTEALLPITGGTASIRKKAIDEMNTSALASAALATNAIQGAGHGHDRHHSVESELKAKAPEGAPAFLGSQLQQIAATVIDGAGSPAVSSPGGGGSPAAQSSAGMSALRAISSPTATNNLNSLASATGLDPSSLLSRLQSGQDLRSLLSSVGQTGYGSTVASSVSGGVMYDEYA